MLQSGSFETVSTKSMWLEPHERRMPPFPTHSQLTGTLTWVYLTCQAALLLTLRWGLQIVFLVWLVFDSAAGLTNTWEAARPIHHGTVFV